MCVDKLKKFFSQIDTMYHIEAVQIIVLYVSCILALIFNKACPSFKHSQWLAFAIGNVVAIAAIILKEYYDFKHPDKQTEILVFFRQGLPCFLSSMDRGFKIRIFQILDPAESVYSSDPAFSKDHTLKSFKVSGIPVKYRQEFIFCSRIVASVKADISLSDQVSSVEIRKSKFAAAERTTEYFLILIEIQDTPALNAGITFKQCHF